MMVVQPEEALRRDERGGLQELGASPSRRLRLARRLAWAGIGLGIVELAVPGALLRAIGIRDGRTSRWIARVMGVREIVTGLGILGRRWPRNWVGARVDGDLLDLGLLAWAMTQRRNEPRCIGYALAAVGAITVLDAWALAKAWRQEPTSDAGRRRKEIARTCAVTIAGSREDIERRWQSMRDEKPTTHGEIELSEAPGGRGIEVRAWAKNRLQVRALEAKLRRLKQLVEVGEVIQSDASLHRRPHPAKPSKRRIEAKSDWELLR